MNHETHQVSKKLNLLPLKSKNRYELVYSKFIEWCKSNNIQSYTENSLLGYFQAFSSTKSLLSTYSMLKTCLKIHNNIDISKFTKLITFLKKQTNNQKQKKSRVLNDEEIEKFINEAPDSIFLLMKVVLIMGISGACRREELFRMTTDNIEFKTDVVIVSVPVRTTICRRFEIFNRSWISVLLKYNELRPNTNKRFFLTYRDGKCINSPVGINTFGKIPTKIAEYLKLEKPDEYTGHCFKRSATLLTNHCNNSFKRLKGNKGTKLRKINPELTEIEEETKTTTSTIDLPGVSILITNCANCPINIYSKYRNSTSDNLT